MPPLRPQNDPDVVRAEYASEERLLARRAAYAGAEGPDANDVLLRLVAERRPARLLEVGCGPGDLAARMAALPGCTVTALDISPRMVELARARGVDARLGDVQQLPFPDRSFDAVVAAWMLYHVPDLDRGLAELGRVLRPDGVLVAVTNSVRHLEELWRLVSSEDYELLFRAENGEAILARHFARVEMVPVEGAVTFPDREAARRYLASSVRAPHLAGRLPPFEGPLRATRRNALFLATEPRAGCHGSRHDPSPAP